MKINGKEIANEILEDLKKEVLNLKEIGISPGLAVISVGNNQASKTYIKNKKSACSKIGIHSKEYALPENVSQEEIINLILKLNEDQNTSGILVQLPLPALLEKEKICNSINPTKDVDAFTQINIGKLMQGTSELIPCTPAGIIEILKHEKINLQGKHCTVIGRSGIVGKPLAILLLQNDATVTICHSKTKNLKELCKISDIIICAVGKPKFLLKDMLKEGVVVIDVGINRDQNGNLCGDVDFENVSSICSYITPVPGGVGPLTVAMLMKNTVKAAKVQEKIKLKEI